MKSLFLILLFMISVSCGGNVDNLTVGDKAPEFTLSDHENATHTISEYKDKSPVVIYFYPKANTSGCTKQACGIRDTYKTFESKEIVVLGISVDTKEDIEEFVNDYNLNFPLLSDLNKEVSAMYGVLNNIGMSSRITFIIDKNGNIANIIRDVDVENHAAQVFELASKLL